MLIGYQKITQLAKIKLYNLQVASVLSVT